MTAAAFAKTKPTYAELAQKARDKFESNPLGRGSYGEYICTVSTMMHLCYDMEERARLIEDFLYPVCELAYTTHAETTKRDGIEADDRLRIAAAIMGFNVQDITKDSLRLRLYESCALPLAMHGAQFQSKCFADSIAKTAAADLVNKMSHLSNGHRREAKDMANSLGLHVALAKYQLRFA